MCTRSAHVRLREFERDWYQRALVALLARLNKLCAKYEDKPHNDAWAVAYDALKRQNLAKAAAKAGVLTDLFEEEK